MQELHHRIKKIEYSPTLALIWLQTIDDVVSVYPTVTIALPRLKEFIRERDLVLTPDVVIEKVGISLYKNDTFKEFVYIGPPVPIPAFDKVTHYNFQCELEKEISKARVKYPNSKHLPLALMEEVGELAQVLIQHVDEPDKKVTHEMIWKEALQVACVACRIATEGVSGHPYDPESGYRGTGWNGYIPNPWQEREQ